MSLPLAEPAAGGGANVAAIVLAAGASRRLGRAKQLLRFEGRTLLRRAVEAALGAGCRPVVVVLGAVPEAAAELADLNVEVVRADDWSLGMGASLRAGLLAISTPLAGVLLTLCDQPRVNAAVLRRLIEQHRPGGITAAQYAGTVGVPVLFDRAFLVDLQRLPPEAGAKQLLGFYRDQVCAVPMPEAACDIDTAADYDQLTS